MPAEAVHVTAVLLVNIAYAKNRCVVLTGMVAVVGLILTAGGGGGGAGVGLRPPPQAVRPDKSTAIRTTARARVDGVRRISDNRNDAGPTIGKYILDNSYRKLEIKIAVLPDINQICWIASQATAPHPRYLSLPGVNASSKQIVRNVQITA